MENDNSMKQYQDFLMRQAQIQNQQAQGMAKGPWGALSQILGAYIQKRSIDGAMNYASGIGDQLGDGSIEQQAQAQHEAAVNSSNNYSFNTPKGAITPQQINAGYQSQTQPEQNQNRGYDFSLNNAKIGGNAYSQTKDSLGAAPLNMFQKAAQSQMANDARINQENEILRKNGWDPEYEAQIRKNPQWYVGSDYVGDNVEARKQAEQHYLDTMQKWHGDDGKWNKEYAAGIAKDPGNYVGSDWTGGNVDAEKQAELHYLDTQRQAHLDRARQTGTPPTSPQQEKQYMSYSDYAAKAKQLKAEAMKKMVSKYGEAAALRASSMIDDAIDSKLQAYGNAIDNKARQQLGQFLLNGDTDTPQGLRQALWAATEYNRQAKAMGREGIDTAYLGQMLAAGDTNIVAKDMGGTVNYYLTNKNGKALGVDAEGNKIMMQPILSEQKSMTPDNAANLKEKAREHDNDLRFKYYANDTGNASRERIAAGNNRASLLAAGMRAESKAASSGSPKMTAAQKQKHDGAIAELNQGISAAVNSIKSGNTYLSDDDENVDTSVGDFCNRVKELINNGTLTGEEAAFYQNKCYEVQYYREKKAGNEEMAQKYYNALTDDYKKDNMK